MGGPGTFVAMAGMRDRLVKYFEDSGVRYLFGIPVAQEEIDPDDYLPEDLLEKIEEVAEESVKDVVGDGYVLAGIDYLEEFEIDGEVVGWEIDFAIAEEMYL